MTTLRIKRYVVPKSVKLLYDKYYVFFLPIAKISYTDKAKYIQLFGIFKIKLK